MHKIHAVFISDLHLHPEDFAIKARFDAFIRWVADAAENLYILGDFLHAWPGDDALDDWSKGLALQIAALKKSGLQVYFMAGNRDFLIGNAFHALANWNALQEPAVINCGDKQVLIAHGDGYCTEDRNHQLFRKLTRNAVFCAIFKHIPFGIRQHLVGALRNRHTSKPLQQMDVVEKAVIADMQVHKLSHLIHGHTHKQMLHEYNINGMMYKRFVLSDWDDNPVLLCYDDSSGFYFEQFKMV